MDFFEMIKNFFNMETVDAIINMITPIAVTVITFISKRANRSIITTDTSVKAISHSVDNLSKDNKKLEESNKQLANQNEVMMKALASFGNIISLVFLNSKAVSGDLKAEISKYVSALIDMGLSLEAPIKTAIDETVKKVEEIKETIDNAAVEREQVAEDTSDKSLALYEQIVDEKDSTEETINK